MTHWLDMLPSQERQKIREKMRSPEAYERLREKVKGPEDLEHELKVSESYANLKFALETEPKTKQQLKERIREDIESNGIDNVLDGKLEQGDFDIAVVENSSSHQEQVVVIPEGNVSEKIPVKPVFAERYLGTFS